MKNNKIIAYLLITVFVFTPFLNVESWGAMRTVPFVKPIHSFEPVPNDTIITVCFPLHNDICCEDYICYGDDLNNCDLLREVPRCYPTQPAK